MASRAAVLERPGSSRLEEVALPKPGPGQVRIRVRGCGICASSLPVWEGRAWFRYPLPPGAPGHEGWGLVEEVGPGVEALRPHDRVAFMQAAMEAVLAGRLDPWPLLSHAWPLEEINRAFEAAGSRPSGFVKAVGTL